MPGNRVSGGGVGGGEQANGTETLQWREDRHPGGASGALETLLPGKMQVTN